MVFLGVEAAVVCSTLPPVLQETHRKELMLPPSSEYNSKELTQVISKTTPSSMDLPAQPHQGCSRMPPAPCGSATAHPQALPSAPGVLGWLHHPTTSKPDVRAGRRYELFCRHLNYCSPTF